MRLADGISYPSFLKIVPRDFLPDCLGVVIPNLKRSEDVLDAFKKISSNVKYKPNARNRRCSHFHASLIQQILKLTKPNI